MPIMKLTFELEDETIWAIQSKMPCPQSKIIIITLEEGNKRCICNRKHSGRDAIHPDRIDKTEKD